MMLTVKYKDGSFRNYSVVNPFRTAIYFVPTSMFLQSYLRVRAFRSLKAAAKFMKKVGCNVIYQDLASGQWLSQGEYYKGEYYEFYTESVKIYYM